MNRWSTYLDRLERSKERIEARVESVDSSKYNTSPGESVWTLAQALEHVIMAEESSVRYVSRKIAEPESLADSGIRQKIQNGLLMVALKTKLRFKAPAVVATMSEDGSVPKLREKWNGLREDLKSLIESFPPELENKCVFRHPISGRMNFEHTLRFMTNHLEHHEDQFDRIARALSNDE